MTAGTWCVKTSQKEKTLLLSEFPLKALFFHPDILIHWQPFLYVRKPGTGRNAVVICTVYAHHSKGLPTSWRRLTGTAVVRLRGYWFVSERSPGVRI